MPGGNQIIYFEAQTGLIRTDLPAYSNFHQYRVLEKHRREIERAVDSATPSGGGLMYAGGIGFIRQLEGWEREAQRCRNERGVRLPIATLTAETTDEAQDVALALIAASRWFQMTPLSHDHWLFEAKNEPGLPNIRRPWKTR